MPHVLEISQKPSLTRLKHVTSKKRITTKNWWNLCSWHRELKGFFIERAADSKDDVVKELELFPRRTEVAMDL